MSTVLSFPAAGEARSGSGGDWSRQELADLYRVEALLIQANMRIETERGTSDEGEPWFVFCRPDGDVFVHLCRIDGLYLLDSPGLDTPLRGSDFAGLIDQFVRGVAARAATSNVVQLRKARHDSVVRLHPGVMMAALIWSLYLASDHLMEAAHAAEASLDGVDDAPMGPVALSDTDALQIIQAIEAQLRAEEAGEQPSGDGAAHGVQARAGVEVARDHHGESGRSGFGGHVATGSLAATLTAIAATYGLHLATQTDGESEKSSEVAQAETIRLAVLPEHEVVVAAVVREESTEPVRFVHEAADRVVVSGPQVASVADLVVVSHYVPIEEPNFEHWAGNVLAAPTKFAPAAPVFVAMPEQVAVAARSTSESVGNQKSADVKALLAAAEQHLGVLKTFSLGGTVVSATFELLTPIVASKDGTGLLTATDLVAAINAEAPPAPYDAPSLAPKDSDIIMLPSLPVPVVGGTSPNGGGGTTQPNKPSVNGNNSGFADYDARAQSFILDFMMKSDKIEMIKMDTALVLIDLTAIDQPTDRYVSKSWVVDDIMTITAIGHYADFYASGMLFA
ncbi:hypothetical protein DEVEQU_01118 [Devosia equisanguinis]|uniref:Uncharacterized protein n=3 Tax=Devosia TaxID=46913 RepID=A0A447I8Z6_9HYPH|nr:hypothetical protein [Devosia equisanguinis]VDS03989.1 hypothetical protein DEVEQU_01118 [Devosia equisanguinis]